MVTPNEPSSRSVYVARVNVHNAGWNGSICTTPTRHDDCRARQDFKSGYCGVGIPRCYHLALFSPVEPLFKLPKTYSSDTVFSRQEPKHGDLVLFWGTYADDENFPVGCWEVESFDPSGPQDYVVRGQRSTIVRFSPRTANYGIMNTRVSRAVGGDVIRLLSADSVHSVMQRWVDDHAAELEATVGTSGA